MAAGTKRSGTKKAGKKADAPGVDAVLSELETVVDELEGGELPLEEALARFEAGVKLARDGAAKLDAMERRVEMLLAEDGEDGGAERVPFESERDFSEDDDDHL